MKYYLLPIGILFFLLNACIKEEKVILFTEIDAPYLYDYANVDDGATWYFESDEGDFEFEIQSPIDTVTGDSYFGNRRRYTPLYGGSYIWERFYFKETDSLITFNITETYDYITILRLEKYSLNLKKYAELLDTWSEQKTLTYTRYSQILDLYLSPHLYNVHFKYTVTGIYENKNVGGVEYGNVITYLVEYTVGSKDFVREFWFADNIGLIYFTDSPSQFSSLDYIGY